MQLRKFSGFSSFFPLALLLVCVAAYALQIASLGFYWDDWQVVFLSRLNSPAEYWRYFSYDRPFSAWTYILSVPLLGMSPLPWQILNVLLRWAGALSLAWTLQGLWPARKTAARWAAVLVAVYPGFSQQAISVAYSQHFITYALFIVSLGLCIWAEQKPHKRWLFTGLALLASLVQLLTMEYFAALELLRPFLLGFVLFELQGRSWKTVRNALLRWLPYLAVLGLFVIYRVYFLPRLLPIPDPNPLVLLEQLRQAPLLALRHLGELALTDSLSITLFAWLNMLQPEALNFNSSALLFSWAIGIIVTALLVSYLIRCEQESSAPSEDHFMLLGLLTALSAVFLGGLPVWATDRQSIVGLWSDRFTLGPMTGAALLIVWLAEWLGQSHKNRQIFLGFFLAAALAAQIQTVNKYRANWEQQKDFYWQLKWRVPALEPGTSLTSVRMPFGLVSDYAISFGLNTLYNPQPQNIQVPYWFTIAPRTFPEYKAGQSYKADLRNIKFEGNSSASLAIHYNKARGCLRALDADYQYAPPLVEDEMDLLPISHTNLILSETNTAVPSGVFGAEPPHTWCYFYQKADLARQFNQWPAISQLWNEAQAKNLQPENGAEYLPFMDASAQQGQWEQTTSFFQAASKFEKMDKFLCSTWRRLEKSTPAADEKTKAGQDIQTLLNCK
jgi:hypothetical protein